MKVFIVGSLNMDLVIRAPFMPENGVTVSGGGFMTNPGGRAPIRRRQSGNSVETRIW